MMNLRKWFALEEKEEEGRDSNETIGEFEKLNEDCILHIFHYLPIVDRIRIERVNKKWKYLSRKSWSKFKSFNFQSDLWGLPNDVIISNVDVVRKVIERCGYYLTTVDFHCRDHNMSESESKHVHELAHTFSIEHISSILQLLHYINSASRIRELHLFSVQDLKCCNCMDEVIYSRFFPFFYCASCGYHWRETFLWLRSHGHHIVTFSLNYRSYYENAVNDMALALKAMTKLKYLRIKFISAPLSATVLLSLSFSTIEELIIDTSRVVSFDLIVSVIPKIWRLRKFKWKSLCDCPDLLFGALGIHAQTLKNLFFVTNSVGMSYNRDDLLANVAKLTGLEKLKVPGNTFVDNEFLSVVANNCKKLVFLNISRCKKVSDHGISSLSNLPNLQLLDMHGLERVVQPRLNKLQALQKLYAYSCFNLTYESLQSFLQEAPEKLNIICLDSTIFERNKTEILQYIAQAIKKRQMKNGIIIQTENCRTNLFTDPEERVEQSHLINLTSLYNIATILLNCCIEKICQYGFSEICGNCFNNI